MSQGDYDRRLDVTYSSIQKQLFCDIAMTMMNYVFKGQLVIMEKVGYMKAKVEESLNTKNIANKNCCQKPLSKCKDNQS